MAAGLLGKANFLSQRVLSFSDSSSSSKEISSLSSSLKLQPLDSEFHGNPIALQQTGRKSQRDNLQSVPVQMSLCIGKAQRWWQKGVQPNMKEITSAQDLHESLLNAGDKLVIVDFFSPGCGGCKALHPKICQFAEMNSDIQFLQVNHEEHKSMCYSLHVHVLPFFRFYRGAHGRLCSFSCTNATIKKFRDALAKHNTDRCSLEPPKGLEESELIALAANKDLNFYYLPKPEIQQPVAEPALEKLEIPLPSSSPVPIKEFKEKTLVTNSGR